MTKGFKTNRVATNGARVTAPIGKAKAERFAAVEGMKKSPTSNALSAKLAARGLTGDEYRVELVRAFKKA
jgi:hypothetical protein